MTFQPVVPSGGLVGWKFLERSYEKQTDVFQRSAVLQRDTAYFAAHIGTVNSAEDLVSDRRLLRVALGAFGLGDDINNRYFVQKILEGGTLSPDALANKMSDNRYHDMAKAFGFDLGVPSTKLSTFPADIIARYRDRQFEVAVGEQDATMRLALNAKRELAALAQDNSSDRTRWFKIMGNEPLRQVIEGALGLPDSFSQIDLDQQLGVLMDKSTQKLGLAGLDDLRKPEVLNNLIERFILQTETRNVPIANGAPIALTLLQR
jgi:hypothetical protein